MEYFALKVTHAQNFYFQRNLKKILFNSLKLIYKKKLDANFHTLKSLPIKASKHRIQSNPPDFSSITFYYFFPLTFFYRLSYLVKLNRQFYIHGLQKHLTAKLQQDEIKKAFDILQCSMSCEGLIELREKKVKHRNFFMFCRENLILLKS